MINLPTDHTVMVSFFDLANNKDNEFYLSGQYSDDSAEQYRQAHIEAFISLIKMGNLNPHEEDLEDRQTVLMRIAWTGRLDLVKTLVEAGADVNAVSLCETSALGEAARIGWQEVYDYLLPLTKSELISKAEKLLPDGLIYRQRKDNKLVEKLINASKAGNLENVINCINSKVEVDAIGSEKQNALQSACSSLIVTKNKEQIVKALLEAGADPNLPEEKESKTTPLDNAVNRRYLEITKLLLGAGADYSKIFLEAIRYNSVETVKFLLKAGAKPDKDFLESAIEVGNTEISQLIIEAKD